MPELHRRLLADVSALGSPYPLWTDDEAFAAYGLDDATINALRAWALEWADGLAAVSSKRPTIRTSSKHVRIRSHL
ncbi:hypothetical protein [Streptomyces sp. enrichment culture]|uniref:hypothetical protein n=1 Tax=Streptomyces sp. enrichment culture TaxID=1795815 RepID=UPI003F54F431